MQIQVLQRQRRQTTDSGVGQRGAHGDAQPTQPRQILCQRRNARVGQAIAALHLESLQQCQAAEQRRVRVVANAPALVQTQRAQIRQVSADFRDAIACHRHRNALNNAVAQDAQRLEAAPLRYDVAQRMKVALGWQANVCARHHVFGIPALARQANLKCRPKISELTKDQHANLEWQPSHRSVIASHCHRHRHQYQQSNSIRTIIDCR
jgi:hypothetical protein